MIKNSKQATATKEILKELEYSLKELHSKINELTHEEFELNSDSLIALISELKRDIEEFEQLANGNFHCFKPEKLSDINKILVAARIAKKITQRELAEIIGVKEQQIQRYESTDYESVTWTRLQEVAFALGLKFYFEKILLLPFEHAFETIDSESAECIENAKTKVKNRGLLIIE